MKLIKYIFTLLVGATALSLTSCNDFLDRDPLGQFTEDDSPNALVGGKIFNVYYLMRSYDITAGIPAFMVHMVRSEDSEKGSDAGDGSNEAAMWDDFEYTASNGPLSAYWGQNYKIIYQCNEILDDIEKSGHKDDTEAIRNRGEALFFRAWCYFNLVRAFGEVPLVTIKVVEASDANVPKTTAEKIYEQIDKDLTEAEECLPLRWDSDYTGRLTWGAARSLHARTYMMRNDWDNMYTASTEVIKSGIYNLNTPVDKVFTVEGENCGESIFELQCEATDAMKEDASIGSQFCQVQGVRGAGEWDLGWGWHMATKLMGEAFEPGDPRELLAGLTLEKLHSIYQSILKKQEDKIDPIRSRFGTIEKEEVSLSEKMLEMKEYAGNHRKFSFRQLLVGQKSRAQLIVTFLSILELMKMGYIHVEQDELFDDIQVDVVRDPVEWTHLTEFADE